MRITLTVVVIGLLVSGVAIADKKYIASVIVKDSNGQMKRAEVPMTLKPLRLPIESKNVACAVGFSVTDGFAQITCVPPGKAKPFMVVAGRFLCNDKDELKLVVRAGSDESHANDKNEQFHILAKCR